MLRNRQGRLSWLFLAILCVPFAACAGAEPSRSAGAPGGKPGVVGECKPVHPGPAIEIPRDKYLWEGIDATSGRCCQAALVEKGHCSELLSKGERDQKLELEEVDSQAEGTVKCCLSFSPGKGGADPSHGKEVPPGHGFMGVNLRPASSE